MALQLHGRHLTPLSPASNLPFVGRITEHPGLPFHARAMEVLLLREPTSELPRGYRAYLLAAAPPLQLLPDTFGLAEEMHYLSSGDVVRIDPRRGSIAALYRRRSDFNTLLVTEQCNNFCVMCSQPPIAADDSWIVDEVRETIRLASPDTKEIGITGGEPTILGDRLVDLVRLLKNVLPQTAVHVLSNGRAFKDRERAEAFAKVAHPDLMFGIPLYSDLPEIHDFVVQAPGAYSETIRGILNLKEQGLRVEVRVVLVKQAVERLKELARFLTRNLLFVDHVALMGLELKGFARTNIDAIWIDPVDYQRDLVDAVTMVDRAGMAVSIYNLQLCVLNEGVWRFARKSISDWKNAYIPDCQSCARRTECGGFFVSSMLRRSRGIRPFSATTPAA